MDGLQNIPPPSSGGSSNNSAPAQTSQSNNSEAVFQREATPHHGKPQQGKEPAQGQPKPDSSQPKSEPEMFEVKVNGRVVKMTRQEALDRASMSYRAHEKFDEASQIRAQVDKLINNAKKNPIEALMDPALGLSKEQIRDAFEQWYNREYIEPETLSPEQRKAKEIEQKLKYYEEQEQKRQLEEQKRHEDMVTQKEREYFQTQIIEALEKSKLPKIPSVVSRIAFYMRESMKNGWDAPMDMIIRQVQSERQSTFGTDIDSLSVDDFVNLYGEAGQKFIDKIQKHALQKLREQRAQRAPGFSANKSPSSLNPNEKLSSTEVNRRLRDMRMGKY